MMRTLHPIQKVDLAFGGEVAGQAFGLVGVDATFNVVVTGQA